MKKLTYIEARDKIWNAYFRDEIKPFNANFCFCGTIAPEEYSNEGFKNWNNHDGKFNKSKHNYSLQEYGLMEIALFKHTGGACSVSVFKGKMFGGLVNIYDPRYEEVLFSGMLAALEVLKQIHRERGEVIPEDEQPLTKRNLAIAQ